jgi:hypothetical protein
VYKIYRIYKQHTFGYIWTLLNWQLRPMLPRLPRPQPESWTAKSFSMGIEVRRTIVSNPPCPPQIQKDPQDWVVANYSSSTCDLWEEVRSEDFFWTRYSMRSSVPFEGNVGMIVTQLEYFPCWTCWRCHDATFLEHPRLIDWKDHGS